MKRKNVLVLVLLLCGGFSLAAQSRTDASIYVPPVTGIGSNSEDNALFYKQLVFELTDQNFNIAKSQESAVYSLIGTLSPYNGRQSSFRLELRDNKTGETTVEGELLYETMDDITDQFSALISTLVYTIPEDSATKWRDNWLYVGASGFWTPRIYVGNNSSTYFTNFGGGISAEFHLLNFMSVEAGLEIASDWIKTSENAAGDYQNILLEIPLLLKCVIKLGTWFMVEPYAGAQFNIPFFNTTKPALASLLAGLQYGVKAGPGAVFVDARFGMDLGNSTVEAIPGRNVSSYQRYIIHLGFGYKFGIFQKE